MRISNRYAKKFESTIKTRIKPSRIHAIGFLMIIPVLFLAVLYSQSSRYGFIIFPLLTVYIIDHYLHHFGLRRVHVLFQQPEKLWTLNGQPDYRLLSSSSIRRYWAILYFKHKDAKWWGRARIVAVFPDSLGREEFRRLRRETKSPFRKGG